MELLVFAPELLHPAKQSEICVFVCCMTTHALSQASQPKPVRKKPEKPVEEPVKQPELPETQPEPELHQASRHGDAELVTKLLEENHDPTVSLGQSPRPYFPSALASSNALSGAAYEEFS